MMTIAMVLMFAASAFADHSPAVESQIKGDFRIEGVENASMKPGAPATWTFAFRHPEGRPLTQFDVEHEKLMHLLVISQDLSELRHIHPDFDPGSGVFKIAVNTPSADQDNQDAARAVTAPGAYFLFGEIKPKGEAVQLVRFMLAADGKAAKARGIQPDKPLPSGEIRKHFEGYQVTLRKEKMGGMLHLNFNIQQGDVGVTDLEPWLGMPGHAVLIAKKGKRVEDKVFKHLHPMHAPAAGQASGPDVTFMVHGEPPPSGIYKIWGQFKRGGRVLTFPFVIEL